MSTYFFIIYCCYIVGQLCTLIFQQLLRSYASIFLILSYRSINPYKFSRCLYFVDSLESFYITLVFLNDYSISQVKFVFCGPPVLLIKVIVFLSFYYPLQMFPCLINTLIINIDYYFILSFYSTTPALLCFLKILLSHDVEKILVTSSMGSSNFVTGM